MFSFPPFAVSSAVWAVVSGSMWHQNGRKELQTWHPLLMVSEKIVNVLFGKDDTSFLGASPSVFFLLIASHRVGD